MSHTKIQYLHCLIGTLMKKLLAKKMMMTMMLAQTFLGQKL